jgi:hypothetical protein
MFQVELRIVVKSAEVTAPGVVDAGKQQQQPQQQQQQPSAVEAFGMRALGTRCSPNFIILNIIFGSNYNAAFRLRRASTVSIDPFCVLQIDGAEV